MAAGGKEEDNQHHATKCGAAEATGRPDISEPPTASDAAGTCRYRTGVPADF
jgi:hypothetical protein